MAVDYYAVFQNYPNRSPKYLKSESTTIWTYGDEPLAQPFKDAKTGSIFELEDFNLDVEQTTNITSQSTGTAAGRVKFNPFSITRATDISSTIMFTNMCVGTPFERIYIGLRKSTGASSSGNSPGGFVYVLFTFAVVMVSKITWAHDEERPKETIEFAYGALQVDYQQQNSNGTGGDKNVGIYSVVTNTNTMPELGFGNSS